jgi:hypothetical protein
MKKVFYEKVGRRYRPVREYDRDLTDSLPAGSHLVTCYPGGESRIYNIDPNHAAMIAASRTASDAMCRAMLNASELRPQSVPLTPGQQSAWQALRKEFGGELFRLQANSTHDIVAAGIDALQQEAAQLMSHPAVQHAYQEFLLVCQLTKTKNANDPR